MFDNRFNSSYYDIHCMSIRSARYGERDGKYNIRSVVLLIIPVKRSTMHHWPRSLHLPSKLDLHPLHKVRRDLDMADVRWMPHGPYIVLLQYASSVEIVDESSVILERLVDVVDLLHEQWALDVCITRSAEATPQRLAR